MKLKTIKDATILGLTIESNLHSQSYYDKLDVDEETKKDLEEIIRNCNWVRGKKLEKIKTKLYYGNK